MPNTPANDAPYVIGAIEDPGTADFDGVGITHVGGFDTDGINPIVVYADGSFTAAFAVSAPSYEWPINATASSGGTVSFLTGGGVAREYSLFSLTPAAGATITYTLAGRNAAGSVVQIPLTPGENGQISITEAILANFAPGAAQQLTVSGLQPSSTVFGSQTVDLAEFYDGAAPTATVPTFVNIVPIPGGAPLYVLSNPSGLTESFTLQNINVWANPTTSYRIAIVTQEQLDLTGVTSGVVQGNFATGAGFRTILSLPVVGGAVSVPPVLLQQVESQFGSVTLQVLGAAAGQIPQAQATVQMPVTTIVEGLYTQNFDADGNPTGEAVRVDVASNALLQDEDDVHYVMSRSAEGGLVIAWLGNDDSDGEADAVYVRKLDDAGNPVGDTVALSGLTAEAFDTIINDEGEAGIVALADGGYAVAYTVEADEVSARFSSFGGGTNGSITVGFGPLRGQLESVQVDTSTAIGANIASQPRAGFVVGLGANGSNLQVPVTIVDGAFQMTEAIRSQFATGAQISLQITGVTNPSAASGAFTFVFVPAFVESRDIFTFDESSALTTISSTNTAGSSSNPAQADTFFGSGIGQTVSFNLNSVTQAVGEVLEYVLYVTATQPIDTTGLTLYSGAFLSPFYNSTPNTVNANLLFGTSIAVTPVANVIDVPAALLEQFPNGGYTVSLILRGVASGTSVSVDTIVRQPSSITEPGVFTQTFDADGVAEGPAQRIDDVDATLAQAAPLADDDGALGITAHADGGFHVSWLAQNTDGSTLDRLITREFDADGELTGTSININGSDIPGVAAAEAAGADSSVAGNLQVVELGDGGFATLVQVEANEISGPVNQVANGGPLFITAAQGRFTSLSVFQATPAAGGVRYFIEGRDESGALLSIELTAENGRVGVPEAVAAQFSDTYYLNFRIDGLQAGTTFSGSTTAADVWNYSDESATITSNGNWTVTSFGGPPIGLAFASQSQSIAFDIVSATPAAGQTPIYLISLQTTFPMDTASAGFPPQNFNPTFNTWESVLQVTPDAAGHIDVPPALLALTEEFGGRINLVALNLAPGSAFITTTTERLPSSIVNEGLFVQLFDSAGQPTGDLIRVDDAATTILADEDSVSASIESDGEGGFRVVWKSDANGDYDGDAINIRQFDQNGVPVGDLLSIDSIPDRVYDEGQSVTLYTSGLFADPDPGDLLTFSATGLPEGLTIDPATGVISGTADESGLHAVVVTATDTGGLSASTSFEIFVVDDGVVEENAGPTAIAFANTVEVTPENGGQIKVADIVLTDDGQGTNDLALSGADAALFSIIDGALYFNGGGDFEGLAAFDVTVSASDATTTDAAVSADFELLLTDVAESKEFTGTGSPEEFVINPLSLDNWTLDMLGGDDYVVTGAGADVINAGQGNDVVLAFAGHDLVLAGGGNDRILGGEGDDDISGEAGNDDLFGDDGDDTLRGGDGLDGIFGGDDDDTIFGNAGNDTLDGEDGDDTILGGFGDDIIGGGNGVDIISGESGADQISGGANNDTIDGGNDNDTIHGDGGEDQILGGAGVDHLFGDEGNDGISGGDGNDTVDGGSGDDTIGGDAGNDILAGGTGFDTISGGVGTDDISGGDDDDVLLGGSGNDTLRGDDDNDTLSGDVGADFLYGGNGDDTVNGEADNDYIEGNDGADILSGGAGNDTIDGGSGSDVISGGVGRDVMTGGLDADTFTFGLASHSRLASLADHITDFDTLLDLIDLSAIDANSKTVGDQAFTWIGAGAFTKSAGQLRYAVVGTATHITGDTNGDGKADFEIVLDNALTQPLTDTDFIL